MGVRQFDVGERVVLRLRRKSIGARVTQVKRQKRRIVTDLGERKVVSTRSLWYPNDKFLMLESRLDRSLRSSRGQGSYIKELLSAYGSTLLYERVHTKEDLRRFLQREGRQPNVRMIHFAGHGHGEQATISLTFEDVPLLDLEPLFKGLKGKVVLFSSCEIGSRKKIMSRLVERCELAGIVAYATEVEDSFSNLAEGMIYDRLILSADPLRKIVRQVNAALKALKIHPCGRSSNRGEVLKCFD